QPEQHPGQAARPPTAPAPTPASGRLRLPPPSPQPECGPQLPAVLPAVLSAPTSPQYVRASSGLASTSTADVKHSAGPRTPSGGSLFSADRPSPSVACVNCMWNPGLSSG
ncbi:hypothetical protein SKAU_G00326900, partial [Synaphobranchus kaupii]